ncbi:F-box only protein 30-like isoform X1 [Phyllopteryx taeniolatus]|uniref:F-box only protein 30-like isoform X1 n=2 Tax=Phyllopteryx taeniolatus TaxID=161469 RepID=UPI002AD527C9|nr:F-box only protein 30-like isoform X1 [Phyllopteryx taeniolatus]
MCSHHPSQNYTHRRLYSCPVERKAFKTEKTLEMAEEHAHCMSCVNQRCLFRPQPGVSCDLTGCPLVCGAVFHSCKAEEHHLLCPLLRVPCLNSAYGCPATMARNQMSPHLEVCPAGVVCCTMEWNRWPVSCTDYSSYERLSRGVEEEEQLDMALALQDQRTLLESLRLIAIAPTVQRGSLGPATKIARLMEPGSSASTELRAATARERIANGINGLNEQHYSKLYEATLETARSLATALELVSGANSSDSRAEGLRAEAALQAGGLDRPVRRQSGQTEDEATEEETSLLTNGCLEIVAQKDTVASQDVVMSPLYDSKEPAQRNLGGALEAVSGANSSGSRAEGVRAEATLQGSRLDGAMQLQNGRTAHEAVEEETSLLTNNCLETVAQKDLVASQDVVCPPLRAHVVLQETGLVLENHKPQEWMLPRSQTPFSQCQWETKTDDKAVDTSDLEQDDDPVRLGEMDPITAALIFCLEESRDCRRISDPLHVDGDRVHLGTQTFPFPAAILVTNTRVGDVASASACDHGALQNSSSLRLGYVQEHLEFAGVPHHYCLPNNARYQHTFPFVCAQSFRRDEFSSHFTNVHGDIHAGLNGWMEYRCPLAFYGCTFSQRRFYPTAPGAKVVHDSHLRAFGVQPHPGAKLSCDSQSDQFSGMPNEILWHIAGFLDSFSLCQLSLVSRTLREVCASLLQTRGIVELRWEKRQCSGDHKTASWQVKHKVWRFSTAFSPVLTWGFTDIPSMSNHLKKCQYNTMEHRTEPVPLPAMCPPQNGCCLRRALRHVST